MVRLRDYLKDSFEIVEIADFFSESICRESVDMAEQGVWHGSNLGTRKVQTSRVDRIWLEEKLRELCPHQIESWLYDGIHPATCQFFKYTADDTFPNHQDAPIVVSPAVQSLFTFVVYLNTCDGGETGFPERQRTITPKLGQAVLFPQNLLHNSARLTSPVKYILRAQVLYRNTGSTPY